MSTHTYDVPITFTAHTPHPERPEVLASHDWVVKVGVTADPDTDGDFTHAPHRRVRTAVQDWATTHLHLAALLAETDPRVEDMAHRGAPHFVVGVDEHSDGLTAPTTAAVAMIVNRVAESFLSRSALPAALTRLAVTGPDGVRVVITNNPDRAAAAQMSDRT